MSDELISGLLKLVSDGKTKSEIETELRMPKNSLSSILTKKKPFPPKWVEPIKTYLSITPSGKIELKIYSLVNPLDNMVFYVGKTQSVLSNRLIGHLSEKLSLTEYKNKRKIDIISTLKGKQLKPKIELLEIVYVTDINETCEREIFWINYFKANGHPITNTKLVDGTYLDKGEIDAQTQRTSQIQEIEAYCSEIGLPLGELVSDHKRLRLEIEGLKRDKNRSDIFTKNKIAVHSNFNFCKNCKLY